MTQAMVVGTYCFEDHWCPVVQPFRMCYHYASSVLLRHKE